MTVHTLTEKNTHTHSQNASFPSVTSILFHNETSLSSRDNRNFSFIIGYVIFLLFFCTKMTQYCHKKAFPLFAQSNSSQSELSDTMSVTTTKALVDLCPKSTLKLIIILYFRQNRSKIYLMFIDSNDISLIGSVNI